MAATFSYSSKQRAHFPHKIPIVESYTYMSKYLIEMKAIVNHARYQT